MTQENQPEADKIIADWSEVYKIEEGIQIDLTPNNDEVERNTRKAKNNSEPLLSQDDINHWSKVYPIEDNTTPELPQSNTSLQNKIDQLRNNSTDNESNTLKPR